MVTDDRDRKRASDEQHFDLLPSVSLGRDPSVAQEGHLLPAQQGDRARGTRLPQRGPVTVIRIHEQDQVPGPPACPLRIISCSNSDQNFPSQRTASSPPEEF